MTPQTPKPSMHQVVTGEWVPNGTDSGAGITAGFGAVINIINGGVECRSDSSSLGKQEAQNRVEYYTELLKYFDLPAEQNMSCANMGAFPKGGSGTQPMYLDVGCWGNNVCCKVVAWETPYSLYAPDDYKRCVCDKFPVASGACGAAMSAEESALAEIYAQGPAIG